MAAGGVTIDDHGVMAALGTLSRGLGDLSAPMGEVGRDVVDETAPLVPYLTGRLVDDLKSDPDGRGGVTVSIGRTPRVGEYARIIDARAGFMPAAQDRAEGIGETRLGAAVDVLLSRTGLRV